MGTLFARQSQTYGVIKALGASRGTVTWPGAWRAYANAARTPSGGVRLLVRRRGQRGGLYSRSHRARARGLYVGRKPKLPGPLAVPGQSRQRAGHRFE